MVLDRLLMGLDLLIALDTNAILDDILNSREIKKLIIKLNTKVQLGDEGIDSQGKSLGEYAPFTIVKREDEGLQVRFIDFNFTGKYWKSWKVSAKNGIIKIETDPARFDDLVNDLKFSEDHVGLTKKHLQEVIDAVIKKYQKALQTKVTLLLAA